MKIKKRYLFLLLLAILTFSNTFYFSDYCYNSLNAFLFLVFSVLFGALFLIITFYNLYKISIKKERFDFVPGILLLLFSVFVIYSVKYPGYYIHKTEIKSFKSLKKIDATTTRIILYSNYTFESKTILEKSDCTKKGSYFFKNDSLYLVKNNSKEEDGFFDKTYYYIENEGLLIPKNKKLPVLEKE